MSHVVPLIPIAKKRLDIVDWIKKRHIVEDIHWQEITSSFKRINDRQMSVIDFDCNCDVPLSFTMICQRQLQVIANELFVKNASLLLSV